MKKSEIKKDHLCLKCGKNIVKNGWICKDCRRRYGYLYYRANTPPKNWENFIYLPPAVDGWLSEEMMKRMDGTFA
jgi:hypothetical protein